MSTMQLITVVSLIAGSGPTATQFWLFAAAVVTAVGAYAGIRYSHSGKIGRTDAETLWDQNQHEKDDMRSDIKDLKVEVGSLRSSNDTLREEHFDCKAELAEVKTRLARLEGGK